MMRSLLLCAAALVLCLTLACAGTPQRTASGETTNKPREHMVVQINNMGVQPRVVRVQGAKNSIVWTNYSHFYATVHFPLSAKSGFTCDELRPNFVVDSAGIESVIAVGDNEDLVTPCPMKPGSYDYTVYLFNSRADRENPQLTVPGTIEVLE